VEELVPTFDDSTQSSAAPEDVWMLLYDPTRFPEWWTGIDSTTKEGDGDYTMYLNGYPDFPMPQALNARPEDRSVTISCMVSDLVFKWRLEPADAGTRISVHVDIPEREASRLEMQRDVIASSLRRLASLAAAQ
jgi:Polyketide cyclase / dehydrase and lipid transport